MEIRTKNQIGLAGFAALLLGGGLYLALPYWPATWTFAKPHGITVSKALAQDMSNFDDQNFMNLIKDLNFDGSTPQQRLALMDKMKSAFDLMSASKKFAMMLAMVKTFMNDPNSLLMGNLRRLMQEYWNTQTKAYIAASPAERQKLLDQRIDEQVAMENLQKVQSAALSLFGASTKPADAGNPMFDANGLPNLDKFRGIMRDSINDAVINTPPEQRAATSQYFLDMRARRLERGLPVMF